MAGRSVHEARTGIIGDVIAGEQRDRELVAAANTLEGVGAGDPAEHFGGYILEPIELELGLGEAFFCQCIGEDELLASLRAEIVLSRGHFIEAVGDARRIGDGAVAGDGPRGGCPDDNRSIN